MSRYFVADPLGHTRNLPAFFLFTQAKARKGRSRSYGEQFERLLKRHRLGTLISTPNNLNLNSGNNVKVWLWKVDRDACRRWWERDRGIAKDKMGR